MIIKAKTVEEYLDKLPEDRREAISRVREVVLENLPKGYEEAMQYNMISYIIPFDIFPDTYNNQPLAYVSLGTQKNHMALYMNNIYSDKDLAEWFVSEYKATGKSLDMGKSCVRFRRLDNLPLDLIAKAVAHTSVEKFISIYKHAQSKKKTNKTKK